LPLFSTKANSASLYKLPPAGESALKQNQFSAIKFPGGKGVVFNQGLADFCQTRWILNSAQGNAPEKRFSLGNRCPQNSLSSFFAGRKIFHIARTPHQITRGLRASGNTPSFSTFKFKDGSEVTRFAQQSKYFLHLR